MFIQLQLSTDQLPENSHHHYRRHSNHRHNSTSSSSTSSPPLSPTTLSPLESPVFSPRLVVPDQPTRSSQHPRRPVPTTAVACTSSWPEAKRHRPVPGLVHSSSRECISPAATSSQVTASSHSTSSITDGPATPTAGTSTHDSVPQLMPSGMSHSTSPFPFLDSQTISKASTKLQTKLQQIKKPSSSASVSEVHNHDYFLLKN